MSPQSYTRSFHVLARCFWHLQEVFDDIQESREVYTATGLDSSEVRSNAL